VKRLALAVVLLVASVAAEALDTTALHATLERLTREGKFSGAVVIRDADGVRFAQGYGFSDPFSERRFRPETSVDSASLAKPVVAAAVLLLARDGKLDLDAPVRRYLSGYPHQETTVRHLLAHSAGLPLDADLEPLAGKTNEMIMNDVADRRLPPLFAPGTGFTYCNYCYTTLALLTERVSGVHLLTFVQQRAALPTDVTIRPMRLADWHDRAVGYRRTPAGEIERADSYESEAFYGSGNLSISAMQLAQWGAEWWQARLAPIRNLATTAARIDGNNTGLTWGNWYCAPRGRRCHYLGHHEGFHHMLYWDANDRIAVAMVSNNTLAPILQQRLQRALVAFASGDPDAGLRELQAELPDESVKQGRYVLPTGEAVVISSDEGRMWVERNRIRYQAYQIGTGIRYVPGLDIYLSGTGHDRVRWLSLYEDMLGEAKGVAGT
jgi:CubicO group peptidase (beta-lactamase class C family)